MNVLICIYAFTSLGYIAVKWLDCMAAACINFKETNQQFFKMAVPLCIPTRSEESSSWFTSLPHLIMASFKSFSFF